MPQHEFRQTMLGTQETGADVFAAAQEIAHRFFLLDGNVNRRQRARAV